jgi:hypothetical protein
MIMKERLFSAVFALLGAAFVLAGAACNGDGGNGEDADADMEVTPDPAGDEVQTDPVPDADAPVDPMPEADAEDAADTTDTTDAVDGTDAVDTIEEDAAADPEPDARACADCDAANACVMLEITRVAEESYLPWIVWPSEADGVGTLIVHAMRGTTDVLARSTISGADMTAADASYTTNLCVTPGTLQIIVFLDDNENAPDTLIYSADYRDTCMGPGSCYRCIELTVSAGEDVGAEAQLYGSCD